MMQRCTNLQVEHLDAPIGVHTDRPRFSWQVTHAQQAYRLEVRGADGGPPYVVRWADGHEGLVYPGDDAHVVAAGA